MNYTANQLMADHDLLNRLMAGIMERMPSEPPKQKPLPHERRTSPLRCWKSELFEEHRGVWVRLWFPAHNYTTDLNATFKVQEKVCGTQRTADFYFANLRAQVHEQMPFSAFTKQMVTANALDRSIALVLAVQEAVR